MSLISQALFQAVSNTYELLLEGGWGAGPILGVFVSWLLFSIQYLQLECCILPATLARDDTKFKESHAYTPLFLYS